MIMEYTGQELMKTDVVSQSLPFLYFSSTAVVFRCSVSCMHIESGRITYARTLLVHIFKGSSR